MVVNQQLTCTGCDQVIKDRYIFQVDNQKLHYNCLKCSKCNCALNGKCWYKQNKFYCREDYDRLIQSMTSCIVCKKPIEKNTLKHTIYNINVHLNCFQCFECGRILNSGDRFVLIKDHKFACSFHYNQKYLLDDKNDEQQSSDQLNAINDSCYSPNQPASQYQAVLDRHQSYLDQQHSTSNSMNLIDYSNFSGNETDEFPCTEAGDDFRLYYDAYTNSPIGRPASDHSIDNCWAQVSCNSASPLNSNENLHLNTTSLQRSKGGRPKKRKVKMDSFKGDQGLLSTINTTALNEQDLNDLNSSNSSSFNQIRLISSNSSSSSTNSSTCGTTRTKRNRTSFKPYQLKMMKDYFRINQNPDGKELIQLSMQTALHKRTLQIWFQNNRSACRKKQKITHSSHDPELGQYLFKMVN